MKAQLLKKDTYKNEKIMIPIEGDKVTSVHILLSTILTDSKIVINNAPKCLDFMNIVDTLKEKKEIIKEKNALIFGKNKAGAFKDISELNKCSRASIGLVSSLCLKNEGLKFTDPSGCTFSSRPIDLHLHLLESFSNIFNKDNGKYEAVLDKTKKDKNININCATKNGTSIGVFFNAISCAYTHKEEIKIHNFPYDNTATQLLELLSKTTNRVIKINGNTVIIEKTEEIQFFDASLTLQPDITMAISYILMGYSNLENIYLENIKKDNFSNKYIEFLDYIGVKIIDCEEGIRFRKSKLENKEVLNVFSIGQEPLITTDLGPVITSFLTMNNFSTIIVDKIYTERKSHISEINRVKNRMIFLNEGVTQISGSTIENILTDFNFSANDIRAGMGIIVSFFNSSLEEITIHNFEQIKRGYGNIEEVLELMGVDLFVREEKFVLS